MTHTMRVAPVYSTATVYHDGDDVIFQPLPAGARLNKEEAEKLARYLAPHLTGPASVTDKADLMSSGQTA